MGDRSGLTPISEIDRTIEEIMGPFKRRPPKGVSPEALAHHERAEEVRRGLGFRLLSDRERFERGLPKYDMEQEYQKSLQWKQERRREEEETRRSDADPAIAAQRASRRAAADAALLRMPTKRPRVECPECGRKVGSREDGKPLGHDCPHGQGCWSLGTGHNNCPHCKLKKGALSGP